LLFLVPESPRWLLIKGNEEKARWIFNKLYEKEKVDASIKSIKDSFAADQKKAKVKDLFNPAFRLILLIGVVVAVSQQISGINAVFFFAPTIFELTGIGTDASFSQATLVGLTNLVFTILAMGFIDKIGRKPLLIGGMTGIILSLFVLANTFSQATYSLNDNNLNEIPIEVNAVKLQPILNTVYESEIDFLQALKAELGGSLVEKNESKFLSIAISINAKLILLGILGFIASFAVSLGPVMWVLLSEIFPNKIRAIAISFVGFINSSISFLVQLVFPWELTNLGSATTFYIYAAFVLCGLVFIIIKVPETKGRTLEEIELDIMNIKSPKTSNS